MAAKSELQRPVGVAVVRKNSPTTCEIIESLAGLTGYDETSYFLTTQSSTRSSALGRPLSDSSDLPALSTALEEQLGLKLQSRKDALQVLVIDAVQQPTEN